MKKRWEGEKTHSTWYQPLEEKDQIEDAIRFTLSQPGVTTIPLPCDVRLWKMILEAAKNFKPMEVEEQNQLIERVKNLEYKPLFPYQN